MKPVAARQSAAACSSSGIGKPQRLEHVRAAARLETERLPCLTTGSPQAARQQRRAGGDVEAARGVAAGADDVDGAQPGGRSGRRARRRMACAKPRTSVGDHALGATARPAARRPAPAAVSGSVSCASSSAASRLGSGRARSSSCSRSSRGCDMACSRAVRAGALADGQAKEIAHQRAAPRASACSPDGTARPRPASWRWRTPMISPSAVRALTSSSAGSARRLRRSANDSGPPRTAAAVRRTACARRAAPARSCRASAGRRAPPCRRTLRRSTDGPRHTPSTGMCPAKARIMSIETPAS